MTSVLERKLELLIDKVTRLEADVRRLNSSAPTSVSSSPAAVAPTSTVAGAQVSSSGSDLVGAVLQLVKVIQGQGARHEALLDHMSRFLVWDR